MSGSMAMASPKTPTSARKAPSTTTPAKSRSSKQSSTKQTSSSTKRKAKNENATSKDATPSKPKKPRNKSTNTNASSTAPEKNDKNKKQKVTHEADIREYLQDHQSPTHMSSQNRPILQSIELDNHQHSPPTPRDTPSTSLVPHAQQQYSPSAMSLTITPTTPQNPYSKPLQFILSALPTLLPPPSESITSQHIHNLTHKLWTILCTRDDCRSLFNFTVKAGAAMPEKKLRALALLSILPGWWVLRERVVEWLLGTGRRVEDGEGSDAASWEVREVEGLERGG